MDNPYYLTNNEYAKRLAAAVRAWRISPRGAGLTQVALAKKSGIGLTPLKRFEHTGAITLRNLIAILRAMDLLENLAMLIPDPEEPGPLEILEAQIKASAKKRKRAPRSQPTEQSG